MAYADVDDLQARFPRALTDVEQTVAEVLLDDSTFLLSTKVAGLAAAIEGGNEVIEQAAMLTVVAMTKRALLAQAAQQQGNPAVDQVSEAWGPFSQSIKFKTDNGNLYLYDSELASLLGLLRGDQSAAASIRSTGL